MTVDELRKELNRLDGDEVVLFDISCEQCDGAETFVYTVSEVRQVKATKTQSPNWKVDWEETDGCKQNAIMLIV